MFGIDPTRFWHFEGSTPPPMVDYTARSGTPSRWRTQLSWGRDTRNNYFTLAGQHPEPSAENALPAHGVSISPHTTSPNTGRYRWCSRPDLTWVTVTLTVHYSRNLRFTAPCRRFRPRPTTPIQPANLPHRHRPANPARPPPPITSRPSPATAPSRSKNFYCRRRSSGKVRGFTGQYPWPRLCSGFAIASRWAARCWWPGSGSHFPVIHSPPPRACLRSWISATYNGYKNFSARPSYALGRYRPAVALAEASLSISYALLLRKKDGDQIERLQFNFGGQL